MASQEALKADIAAARARLADNLELLVDDVHPKNVLGRGKNEAKAFVSAEVATVKQTARENLLSPSGKPRWDRIALAGGGLVGALGALRVIRSIVKG